MGKVRNQVNGRIVVPFATCPAKAFITRLFARKRSSIHKRLYALSDRLLALAKVELVLKERDPGVGCRGTDENIVLVIQVSYFQILGGAHRDLLLQRTGYFHQRYGVRDIRE